MVQTRPSTETVAIDIAAADEQLARLVDVVAQPGTRVLFQQDGRPVAALISVRDLDRLDHFDAEWARGWEALDAIGAAFADVDPDEIERETAKALAEVRAEMRAERDAEARR
jgi:antitoxin (DNA-binding transcriptional repressor) of toxin-antitoxin stability system